MTLDLGTRIGADGKRHPIDGCDIPEDSESENRAVMPIFGIPGADMVPVWNAARGRLEWGTGGGGGGDSYADIQAALENLTLAVAGINDIPGRVELIEQVNTDQEATLTSVLATLDEVTLTTGSLADIPGRLDEVEANYVTSPHGQDHEFGLDAIAGGVYSAGGLTHIERVTQLEYDALTPDPNTLYVIVAAEA